MATGCTDDMITLTYYLIKLSNPKPSKVYIYVWSENYIFKGTLKICLREDQES